MSNAIRLTYDGPIALLELNEPKSRNAFSDAIKDALANAMEQLSNNKNLRALIFTGSEGVFCAGGDLKAMLTRHLSGEKFDEAIAKHRMEILHDWFKKFRDLPVPVIVAIDGPAFGAGLGLALAGDIVIASDRASFGASFAKVGAVPDCNLMWSLPRIVGLQRARELFYTARTINAEEAQKLGLCLEVVSAENLLPRARELAEMMVEASPLAFAKTKAITAKAMEIDSDTMLALEADAQSQCLTSPYHYDAIARFADKKPTKFSFR